MSYTNSTEKQKNKSCKSKHFACKVVNSLVLRINRSTGNEF